MWRLSDTPGVGTLRPMALVRDLDLSICKEFYKHTVLLIKSSWFLSSNREV